jgi:hypothetical protein
MTNNEFVKGFIVEAKGIPINWVAATITIAKKIKAQGIGKIQIQYKGLFKAKRKCNRGWRCN